MSLRYLCETYDTHGLLLPKDPKLRAHAREWIAAAEGTFALHSISILYGRRRLTGPASEYLPAFEQGLEANVHNDLGWLEGQLKQQQERGHRFLIGDEPGAADIMMQFSVQFMMACRLGVKGRGAKQWPEVEAWLERTEACEKYKRAVENTGYTLAAFTK